MVYIIIPVFNRKNYTRECLVSIQKQTFLEYKIIVVDHGSTDGTSSMIQEEFPAVILLHGDKSMWWTAATNMGIIKSLEISVNDDDFVLTLNNDLEVKSDYLEQLLKIYENHKPCLVGSTSLYINNKDKISYIGGTWNSFTAKHKANKFTNVPYKKVEAMFDSVHTDLLPGRGTLVPLSVFKKVGLFDEKHFPHYGADEDFSLMAKKAGYKLWVSTKAVVYSHVDETGTKALSQKNTLSYWYHFFTSIKAATNVRNRWMWAKKNSPIPVLYFSLDMGRIILSQFVKKH